MNWLSPDSAKFHRNTKSRLLERIAEEHGVFSSEDYLQKFSEETLSDLEGGTRYTDSKSFANSPDGSSHYRCFPADDQPYMLLTNNPGTATNLERSLHRNMGGDVNDIAAVCRVYIVNYLLGKSKFTKFLERLGGIATKGELANYTDISSYLQEEEATEWRYKVEEELMEPSNRVEWISENPNAGPSLETGFLNDFYYSVAYKLESTSVDDLTKIEKKFAKETLNGEIQAVDPEVIICSGGLAWNTVRSNMENETPIGGSKMHRGIMDAQGGVFRADIAGDRRTIIAARHPAVLHKQEKLVKRAELAEVF